MDLSTLLSVYNTEASFVSYKGLRALVDAGLVKVEGELKGPGRPTIPTYDILLRFAADPSSATKSGLERLLSEGFVMVVEKKKSVRGRPAPVYGLTGKGRSRVALLTRNRDAAAKRAALVTAVIANNDSGSSDTVADENASVAA
jgi:hypothetical protein